MKKYLFVYLFVGWGFAVSGQPLIQSYEYWFNSNTGAKTMEAIASPAASFDLAVQADASHLPDGVNTFTVRFKDDLGHWSSPITRFFVKIPEQQFAALPKNIVAWEYRMNNEPFVKQGVTPATSFVLNEQINTDDLPDGVNTFTIRFKDDLGNWSSPLTRFFVKIPEQQFSTMPKNIVAWEYRMNNEPFVNRGIASAASFILEEQIGTDDLPDGINTFTVRFKDDLGNWSAPLTRFFVKIPEQQFSTVPKKIVACEYRLNSETTVKQEVAPVESFVLDQQIDASKLPEGLNVFMVRFRDNLGNWSSPLTRFFVKIPETDVSLSENLIKAYEYRLEDSLGNPVAGTNSTTATFVSLDAPVNPALIEFEIALSHLPMGDYIVHFRALDIRNQWSSLLSRTIEKEALAVAAFSFTREVCIGSAIQFDNESVDADTWLWNFGDGTTSTEFEPEHVYSEAGDYEVSLVAMNTEIPLNVHGRDSLIAKQVTVKTVNTEVLQNENVLTAKATDASFQWLDCDHGFAPIDGETNQTFAPVKNGNYAVEITEKGCVGRSGCYAVTSVGILESSYEREIIIYPNPTIGRVTIELGREYPETIVAIYTLNGLLLHQLVFLNTSQFEVNIVNAPGVYLISLQSGNRKALFRVVKN